MFSLAPLFWTMPFWGGVMVSLPPPPFFWSMPFGTVMVSLCFLSLCLSFNIAIMY